MHPAFDQPQPFARDREEGPQDPVRAHGRLSAAGRRRAVGDRSAATGSCAARRVGGRGSGSGRPLVRRSGHRAGSRRRRQRERRRARALSRRRSGGEPPTAGAADRPAWRRARLRQPRCAVRRRRDIASRRHPLRCCGRPPPFGNRRRQDSPAFPSLRLPGSAAAARPAEAMLRRHRAGVSVPPAAGAKFPANVMPTPLRPYASTSGGGR